MAASYPQRFHQEYVLLLDRRVKEGMEAAGSVGWRTAREAPGGAEPLPFSSLQGLEPCGCCPCGEFSFVVAKAEMQQ